MSDDMISTDNPLTDTERTNLESLLNSMIPESAEHKVPGAGDPLISACILASAASRDMDLGVGLRALAELSQEQHGAQFASIPDEDKLSLAQGMMMTQPAFVQALFTLTLECYYTDDRVMESLGMEARPPFPLGQEVEQGDWSLLDPVKAREKFYREV